MKTSIIKNIKSINQQKEDLKKNLMLSISKKYKSETEINKIVTKMLNKLTFKELSFLMLMIITSK